MTSRAGSVFVESPARLHFGMLDLAGSYGRRFGGIGAGVCSPSLLLEAVPSDAVSAEGPDGARAADFARRFVASSGIAGGAHVRVHRALPSHAGLGSGTQLALAVARALAALHSVGGDAAELARAVGRRTRSGVGTWVSAGGGLVVEGGRRDAGDAVAPLLARHAFPESWRCVVAIPAGGASVSGPAEVEAFASLAVPSSRDAERVAHLVLMALLPALVEADIEGFGRALTEIQLINGRWFAPAQGGPFAKRSAAIVERMAALGAYGVGQSSWGPAVYGVVDGGAAGEALAARIRDEIGDGAVYESAFSNEGVIVSRA